LPKPANTNTQIGLPIASGGIGMVPYHRLRSAAYVGAMALTIKSMNPKMAEILSSNPLLPTSKSIENALKHIHDLGSTHFKSKTTKDFVMEVRSEANKENVRFSQTKIMQEINETIAKKELPKRDRARIISASHEKASLWLTKCPTNPSFQLSGLDLAAAIQHRIGLAPTDLINARCTCGTQISDTNYDHYHLCRTVLSSTTVRHNTVLSAIQKIAMAAGSNVHREYRATLRNKKKTKLRPDASIIGLDHSFLIDVSITTPTAKTIINKAGALKPLFAAHSREITKRNKYCDLATQEHAYFAGVVMESYGAMGAEIHALLDTLNIANKGVNENSNWNLKQWGYSVLSFALQRGNGRLVYAATD
jgi:hypothetical protein